MTIKTVYVVRHGQRESHDFWALSECGTSRGFLFLSPEISGPTGAAIDPPLKKAGVTQAEELAKHFSDSKISVDAILSSPY